MTGEISLGAVTRLCVMAVLLLTVGGAGQAVANIPPPPEGAPPFGNETELSNAAKDKLWQGYADSYGVSTQEAARRFQRMESTRDIPSVAGARLGKRYGGMYFDTATGELVIQIVDRTDLPAVEDLLESDGVSRDAARVDVVKFSQDQLEATEIQVRKVIATVDPKVRVVTALNNAENRVEIDLPEDAGGDLAAVVKAAQASAAPDSIKINSVPAGSEPERTDASPYCFFWDSSIKRAGCSGGLAASGLALIAEGSGMTRHCTVAFAAGHSGWVGGQSSVYVLTAGHCLAPNTNYYIYDYSNPAAPVRRKLGRTTTTDTIVNNGTSDYGRILVEDGTSYYFGAVGLFKWWDMLNPVMDTQVPGSAQDALQGWPICSSGSTSGVQCGVVTRASVTYNDANGSWPSSSTGHYIESDSCAAPGDSGSGAVVPFSPIVGTGITSGINVSVQFGYRTSAECVIDEGDTSGNINNVRVGDGHPNGLAGAGWPSNRPNQAHTHRTYFQKISTPLQSMNLKLLGNWATLPLVLNP